MADASATGLAVANTHADARPVSFTNASALWRLQHARPVPRDGRWLLRERWMADAGAARRAEPNADTFTLAESDADSPAERWLHDAGSIRRDGRRLLRERRLEHAATAGLRPSASAAANAKPHSEPRRVHHS